MNFRSREGHNKIHENIPTMISINTLAHSCEELGLYNINAVLNNVTFSDSIKNI